ncbi:MAG: Uncharacterised protein [Methanobacteriota archaeon]|nr:MAG: Uncharacterised protein [Euryarchaeota archaeon]
MFTLMPCQELPVIISPERNERAFGVIIGPGSSACAVIGAVTLIVNVEFLPEFIAKSGVLSNSTTQLEEPVVSMSGLKTSILLALFHILNVTSIVSPAPM